MSAEVEERFLRIKEVLEILAICRSTYYKLRKQGLLGPAKVVGERGIRHPRSYIIGYRDSRPDAD